METYPKRRLIEWNDAQTGKNVGRAEYLLATPETEYAEEAIELIRKHLYLVLDGIELLVKIDAAQPLLKSAHEWSKECGHTILDPDGWRKADGITLDSLITIKEYRERFAKSTAKLRKNNA